jgi:putative inorganic carbon (HCO3(-)) transporter
MAYFLFLLVNAALFLRPGELIPQLEETHVYEILIVPCLLVSVWRVANQLTPRALFARPITACVVGLMGAVIVSALLNPATGDEFSDCFSFWKLLIYYLLLVAVVDTPGKLRGFVYYIGGLILVLTVLSLLRYYNVIDIPVLDAYAERQFENDDEETGQVGEVLLRLRGAGLFRNPNDFSRVLMVGFLIALYGLGDRALPVPRLVWATLLAASGFALTLTFSRGGVLGLVAALVAVVWVRLGSLKTIGLALVVLPLFLVLSGRLTQISTSKGTGHTRIEYWSDYFVEWRQAPLFGLGMNNYANLGTAAHNSFLQTYVDLGFVGGTFFLGAFYLGVLLPFRTGRQSTWVPEDELRRFRPYLIGIVVGYMIGMTSASINYMVTTYTVVGLAAVYTRLAGVYLPATLTNLNGRLVRHGLLVSVLSVVALYLFVRISLSLG